MISRIASIFEWCKNVGVDENLSLGMRLRIRMINSICILIIALGLIFIAFVSISGLQKNLLLQTALILSFGLVMFLNLKRSYDFSRIAFVLFTNVMMFYISYFDYSNTGNSFYFFLLPLGILLVFEADEKFKIIGCILVSLLNYIIVYLNDFSLIVPHFNYQPQLVPFLNYISFILYMIMISIMSYFFVNGNRVINNELLNEQRRFDDLERIAHVGSWRINLPSAIINASDELLELFNFSDEANPVITPQSLLSRIHADDRRKVYNSFQELVKNNGEFEITFRIAIKGEKTKYVTSRATVEKDSDGMLAHIDGALIDITRQVESRKRISNNLKEKEILLAEMHHRVKNNLAVISGLIQLQSFKVDEEAQIQFFEIHNKINTIALIHEKFYQSESLTKINLVNFVKELESQIERTIAVRDCEIITNYKIDDIYLTINYAIPAALILNELITNSYKHAFKGKKQGRINIKIQKNEDTFILHYKDNGKGLPTHADFFDSKNQGLSLINMLAKSMNFEFAATNQNGFYFTMYKSEVTTNKES